MEAHLLFIDYEKAFDNTQRQILFNILKSRHIPDTLLKAGHAVAQLVEALRYKPEVREFHSQWSLEFFIDIILPAALWPWGRLGL